MDFDDQLVALGDFIKGTCELMCPEKERTIREREKLLHPLEQLEQPSENESTQKSKEKKRVNKNVQHRADPSKIVKAFSRSAAGVKMPAPSDLRPFPVLEATVSYLIEKVACSEIETARWLDRYNFVTDRLRAVRQDMVIQGLPPAESIRLLEPMAKFHVFAGYWLCENPIQLYDPKINASFLQECIKRLLVMYDAVRQSKRDMILRKCSQESPITQHGQHDTCSITEHLMEALYLIINLGDPQALNRSLIKQGNIPDTGNSCAEHLACQLSLASWRGEYVRVCRYIRHLSPLLCMAAALHLPSIRRRALMVMTTAFSCKTIKFPITVLQKMLLWNDSIQVSSECRYYGLIVEESKDTESFLYFQKGKFNSDVRLISPSRLCWVDESVTKLNVTKILSTTNSEDLY